MNVALALGWLVTARLLVRSPAPPSCVSVVVSLSKTPHPNPNLVDPVELAVALRGRFGCRCVHKERVNVSQHCIGPWIKALCK